MKRAFPHHNPPASLNELQAHLGSDAFRATLPEQHRRVRTSAAALGLAISMGASGIGLAEDAAVAAEPVVKSAPTLMPPTVDKTSVIPDEQVQKVDLTPVDSHSPSNYESPKAPVAQEPSQEHVTHVVQSGHTLWRIAKAYQVTAGSIATANGLPSIETPLEIGEVLRVPVTDTMVYPPREIITPDTSSNTAEVQDTETQLAQVAPSTKTHPNTDLTDSTSATRISNSVSDVEDSKIISSTASPSSTASLDEDKLVLATPSARAEVDTNDSLSATPTLESLNSTASIGSETPRMRLNRAFLEREGERVEAIELHEVRQGETLISLANEHQTTIEEIARVNNLDDPNNITAGQRLDIPKQIARRAAPVEVFGEDRNLASVPGKKRRLDLVQARVEDDPSELALSPLNEERATNVELSNAEPSIEMPEMVAVDLETPEITSADGIVEGSESATAPVNETLRADIARLRNRVRRTDVERSQPLPTPDRDQSVDGLVHVDASDRSLGTVREHNNPQFDREQVASVHEAERQASEARSSESELANAATTPTDDDDKVAVAPIGSQNYAPIMEPRSVSPDIPSLPSSGAYLPKPEQRQEVFNGYIWPAQGVLTSGYGWRWGRMHRGIDIAGPVGTPIVASAPGTVTYSRWNSGGYGNLVEVTHPDGSLTLYAHNNRNLVSEGENVAQGQQIAEMGNTGFSTGPHLHFEIHRPGQGATDPMAFLPR